MPRWTTNAGALTPPLSSRRTPAKRRRNQRATVGIANRLSRARVANLMPSVGAIGSLVSHVHHVCHRGVRLAGTCKCSARFTSPDTEYCTYIRQRSSSRVAHLGHCDTRWPGGSRPTARQPRRRDRHFRSLGANRAHPGVHAQVAVAVIGTPSLPTRRRRRRRYAPPPPSPPPPPPRPVVRGQSRPPGAALLGATRCVTYARARRRPYLSPPSIRTGW